VKEIEGHIKPQSSFFWENFISKIIHWTASIVILSNLNDGSINRLDSFGLIFNEIRRVLFNARPVLDIKNVQVEINGNTVNTRALVQGDEILLPLVEMCNALDAVITDDSIELNGIVITRNSRPFSYH
jgi:hypothetical protein